jgi:hypothetical protein
MQVMLFHDSISRTDHWFGITLLYITLNIIIQIYSLIGTSHMRRHHCFMSAYPEAFSTPRVKRTPNVKVKKGYNHFS